MIGFITSRASIEFFGRTTEKEDMLPVEFTQTEHITFKLQKTDSLYRLITKAKIFAISIPRKDTTKEQHICEIHEGLFEDKFILTGFKKVECTTIDCPAIGTATVLECEFVKEKVSGNTAEITGRIVTIKET
jgi:flavin reductase (DIM6/NTAB) family NADH-FMN oxidoreductase RutF